MQTALFHLDHWPSVVGHVSSLIDLEVSARTHKALVRKRGVRSAADLLHLALLYGPGRLSLRAVASHATEAGIADLCDVSLLDRLRNSGDFLADVLDRLLADRRGDTPMEGRLQLNLVDGSTVSIPGSKGSDWRLHARYEPARGCFTDLAMTKAATAEALSCVAVRPGDVLVQDRGYARVRNFAHAHANQADFITRIGWRSVNVFDASRQAFDLVAALSDNGPSVVEHAVSIGAGRAPVRARLIIARKPPEATERQHKRLHRKASRKGHKTDPRTLRAAGYMMLLTSLSPEQATAAEVVRLYRMRWQVELAFKRLKSLGGFAALQASDPKLARSWLLAHLIAAVLIETSLGEDLGFPP
ncbi:IS4 family transposase [Rhodopila sp.]|uniref:IS4 family transposase n=1 Tax=Rhodopila sp. TaxID=2480087 RepID=UPI003D0CAF01